jgi:hypothetical protein
MAKGKKSSGKTYNSKGERNNTSRWLVKACRRDYMENRPLERANNQRNAFLKGKRVMLTIENPNKNETNKRFIRVPANEVWKTGRHSMKSSG